MPKRKHRDETEFFRGQIRERDKLIRSLQRRIKELDKQQHLFNDLAEEIIEDLTPQSNCPKCRQGVFVEKDFKYVTYNVCNNQECRHREKKNTTR